MENETNGIAWCLARHPNAWNDSATRSTDSLRCNIAEGRSNNHPLKFYCITPPSPNSWTSWIGISGEAIMRRRRRLHQAWQCGPGGWRWARDWPRLGRALTLALATRRDKIQDGQASINGPSDFAHLLGTDAFEASTLIVIIPSSSLPSLRDLVLVSR